MNPVKHSFGREAETLYENVDILLLTIDKSKTSLKV